MITSDLSGGQGRTEGQCSAVHVLLVCSQHKFGHPWGSHDKWAGTGELLVGCAEAHGSEHGVCDGQS